MKKSLIALAVLAASGAAMAQSSVTLYGVVDIAFASENNGTTTVSRLDSGKLNGSRFGFKGSEDLGGGLAAVFQLESGFNTDTGASGSTSSLFNRLSFVGLTGNFGAVKLGRQNNPVYANTSTCDPMGNNLSGDTARLFGNTTGASTGYNGSRTDNVISYGYAANGFRGEFQYGLGEQAGNAAANRTVAGFVGYKAGAVDVVLTVQDIRNLADTDSTKMTLLGGNYDFGVVKAFATVAVEKGVGTLDKRDVLIGLRAPVSSAGTVIVSYIKKTDNVVANADATQFAIAYTHDLSKRTALYTSYGKLDNNANAAYMTTAGKTDSLFLAGVRHSF